RPVRVAMRDRVVLAAAAVACVATSYIPPTSPVANKGRVYASQTGPVVLDERTGARAPAVRVPHALGEDAEFFDGVTYGTVDAHLVAVDLATGKYVFQRKDPDASFEGGARAAPGIVVAERMNTTPKQRVVVAADPKTGRSIWEAPLGAGNLYRGWQPVIAGDV